MRVAVLFTSLLLHHLYTLFKKGKEILGIQTFHIQIRHVGIATTLAVENLCLSPFCSDCGCLGNPLDKSKNVDQIFYSRKQKTKQTCLPGGSRRERLGYKGNKHGVSVTLKRDQEEAIS